MSDHSTEYQEHVLNAPDVCSNCFSLVQIERERPASGWRPAETFYCRNQATTTIDHVPAETVSESKHVFCRCGANSAFTRIWKWRDIDRARFKMLIWNLIRAVERKGLQVARTPTVSHALASYDRHPDVTDYGPFEESHIGCIDEALADGLLAGLRIKAVRSSGDSTTA